ELTYRAVTKDGQELVLNVLPELKTWLVICGIILLLRLLWLFALSFPEQRRRTAQILAPINELAAKADELSRLEFSEDKYQLLEDAITQLDEGGKLSLRDSELVGIEAAINNLLTRVRESNRQQARFVNDASHELRTPIAVIGGYADMLERWGKDDEKVLNESIAAIRTETARMKHLVEQLLFLARGDSGKTQLQLEEIDAGALLKEAYEESVMIDEDHVYRLRESGEVLPVQADQGLLKQAVRILLDNAAKYTAKGDEIILSSGRQEGHVYLQVQDTGIGMAEADVEHMFERFYRADEARSFEGTGLGLSIAKWIVDKHGGHFEIVSREDLGTRIRIVL
ncbi:MAG: sensor histidine kinase, partial [Firmicutes bacterium]|nr:sensor histidine kinase [Bacillota bacterium]